MFFFRNMTKFLRKRANILVVESFRHPVRSNERNEWHFDGYLSEKHDAVSKEKERNIRAVRDGDSD